MAYATVTLTGTYQTPDGTPHKGHVEIIPSERVIKDTTGDIILTGRVKVDLDAQGAFTVVLPATDDPTLNPTGFGYTIAAKLHSSHPPAVSFSLPAALGATTVEDLTPVDPSTFAPTTTYAESSEVAALDSRVTTLETTPTVTSYNDLTDTPSLATVATTGNYTDLTGQPVIPTTPEDVGAEPAGLSQATNNALADTIASGVDDLRYDPLTRTYNRPRMSTARKIMDNPPTIGAERTATAIASGKKWSPLTGGGGTSATVDPAAPFLYVGGFASKLLKYSGYPPGSSTGFPNYNYVYSTHLTTVNTANPVQAISFGFDGTELEINLRTVGGQAYRLMVDGEYVNTTDSTAISTVGQVWIPVTFATRKPRIITVETYNTPFGGVVTGPNDTVWKPTPVGPRVIVMGDSYTGGSGANSYASAYVATFRDIMGWRDVIQSGVGGTGYIKATTAGTVPFSQRLQNDVLDLNPDVVVIAGGHNDYPDYTQSQIETAAQTLYETIRAALPDVHLFVVGPYAQGASAAEYATTVGQWIKNAVDAANAANPGTVDAYVSADYWFTGAGNTSATTGSGNSDLYISSDGVHPTQAGHDYMGYRLAEAISAKLPA